MQFNNKQAIDVLAKLHAGGFPSAIVAGGCVRDEIFGKPVKDIDVFVSYEDYENRTVNIQDVLGREVVLDGDSGDYEGGEDAEVRGVVSLEPHEGELPVQVIVLAPGMSPLDRVGRFDFGFCQVAWDGNNLEFSLGFLKDFNNKTITLVHCENQQEFDRSWVRLNRLMKKYLEFDYVIPEKYHGYV